MQRRGRIISNFTKERPFILITTKCSWGPPSSTLQKRPWSPLLFWPRREHSWTLNWKERLLICFENFLYALFWHRLSRNRMMKTFIIVNIVPSYPLNLCFPTPKRSSFFLQLGHEQKIVGYSFERRAY